MPSGNFFPYSIYSLYKTYTEKLLKKWTKQYDSQLNPICKTYEPVNNILLSEVVLFNLFFLHFVILLIVYSYTYRWLKKTRLWWKTTIHTAVGTAASMAVDTRPRLFTQQGKNFLNHVDIFQNRLGKIHFKKTPKEAPC